MSNPTSPTTPSQRRPLHEVAATLGVRIRASPVAAAGGFHIDLRRYRRAAKAAADHGITSEVVKLPEAERGVVLPPRRWGVERTFASMARFRRLARDYERQPATLAGLHLVAFSVLLL